MNKLLKLEELAMLGLCIYALYLLKAEWWFYPLILVAPDISLLGYAAGNKIGAILYNIFHHKGVAIILIMIGFSTNNQWIGIIGIILFGHSSMDRIFGYGLKYFEGFKFTHLGLIGKK